MGGVAEWRVSEAVVIVDVERADTGRLDVSVQLTEGGFRTPVVSWIADVPTNGLMVVAAERSPDRSCVAVVAGAELFRIDLRDGTRAVVDAGVSWPPYGDGVIAWEDGSPLVMAVEADGPRRVPMHHGRTLVLDAPVSADDGFSGGDQSSMAGVAMPLGTSQDDVLRARDELHASLDDQALIERRAWVRIDGPHPPAALLDEDASGAYGYTNVHWPVSSGPSGTIVRRSTTRFTGGGAAETEIDRPWFVRPDGTVTTLNVRLGNAPLCELPDGRWLMPGADALWCDAGNEPLHALHLDGRLTPWNPDTPTSTASLLRAVAPDLLPPSPPENLDDWPWATSARLTGDGQRVVFLITEVPWSPLWDPEGTIAWAVVEVSADGSGTPLLLASGRRTPTRFAAITV